LLVYKQFRKFTYEDLLTDIGDNYSLRAYLGLNELPNYTTLIKFGKNLSFDLIEKIVFAFKNLISKPKKVAIDSTGISLDNASPHYCKRIGMTFKKRPFMKTSFIVDIDTHIILLCKTRKSHANDTKEAKPMIKKLAKYYAPDILFGDRGHDDNKSFQLVSETLGAYPLILQRNLHVPKRRRHGPYRKKTYSVFDYSLYLQRNKVETCNPMYKRKFGGNAKSRLCKIKKSRFY